MKNENNEQLMVDNLQVMAKANNYSNWIYKQIAPFIGSRILEVGSGIGTFTSMLVDHEYVIASDKNQKCFAELLTNIGKEFPTPLKIDIENSQEILELHGQFDTVICLNVLEHIKNDLQALSNIKLTLVSGGRLILLVPAFQIIYGSLDLEVEHCRRYSRKNLVQKLTKTGYEIEKSFYMNFFGIFIWFLLGTCLRQKKECEKQVSFGDRYLAPLGERLEQIIPPPIGLSIVVIARK